MGFGYRGEVYWRRVLAAEIKAAIDSGSELNAYGAFLLVRDGRVVRVPWRERRMHRLFEMACERPSVVGALSRGRFNALVRFVRGLDVRMLGSAACVPVVVEMVLSRKASTEFVLWVWGAMRDMRVRDAVLACDVLSDEQKVVLALSGKPE